MVVHARVVFSVIILQMFPCNNAKYKRDTISGTQ
jgi:hypothetical protein